MFVAVTMLCFVLYGRKLRGICFCSSAPPPQLVYTPPLAPSAAVSARLHPKRELVSEVREQERSEAPRESLPGWLHLPLPLPR